jgi:hypothetical protein
MAQTQRDAHTIAAATRACPRHVPVLIHTRPTLRQGHQPLS